SKPMVSFCSLKISFPNTCIVLIFFIAGLLFCALSTSNIGSVSHPAGDRPSHPIWLVDRTSGFRDRHLVGSAFESGVGPQCSRKFAGGTPPHYSANCAIQDRRVAQHRIYNALN